MLKFLKNILLSTALLLGACFAEPPSQPINVVGVGITYQLTAPSGACGSTATDISVIGPGSLYSCQNGIWAQISGGGGSSAFSAITAGTNTGQALVIGNGSTLSATGSGTITATNGVPAGSQYNPLINTSGASIYATSPLFFDTTQASGADRGLAVHGVWTTGYGSNPVKSLLMDMSGEIVNDTTLGHGQIQFLTNFLPVTVTYGGSDPNVGPTFKLPPAGLQMNVPAQLGGDQVFMYGEGPGGVLGSSIQGTLFSPGNGTCPIATTTASAFNPGVFVFGVNAGNITQGLGPYTNKITGFSVDADYYAPGATVQSNCIPFTYYSGQDSNYIEWISVQNGMGVNLDMGGGSSSVAGNGKVGGIFSKHADTQSCISQSVPIASWAIQATNSGTAATAVVTYSGTPSTGTVTTANSGGNTTLTIATGPNFPYATTITSGYITVNGVLQTIASVQSATQITITGNLGSHTYPYNIGPSETPQIGGGVQITGAAVGGTHGLSINRNSALGTGSWTKICAVPGPSNTAEVIDLRCQGVTFSSASQFAFLVNQAQTDSSGTAQGTAWYKPVGVRWDAKVLSGGKELGPMSISSQSCVSTTGNTVGVTQAEGAGFDISGDLEEAHDIHTESSPIGIQVGTNGVTHDITLINSNPSSQIDVGLYLDNYWGALTDINVLGLACAATNSTGATAATTCLDDIQNGNVTTSTHNKYTGFYFLDHGGDPITDADPQGGVEIANGITFFGRVITGWNAGTAEFSINGKTGVTNIAGAVTLSAAATTNTPALDLTGTPVVGSGTSTNSTPLLYFNAGTAPTTWSTSGTELGFNAPSGFIGNFIDAHVNGGASVAKLDYLGNSTGLSYNTIGSNGGITGTEGTGAALTAGTGSDLLYPDSTNHCWHQNLNNSDKGCIPFSFTSPLVNTNGVVACATCLTTSSGPALNIVTGSAAQATGTETAAGNNYTFAGVETGARVSPFVIQDTNSTNNNANNALIVNGAGTSTGEVPLDVNSVSGTGDIAQFHSGETITNGTSSGGTLEAHITAGGALGLGANPALTPGTGAAIAGVEGTSATGIASSDILDANSTQHAFSVNNNNTGDMPVSRAGCMNVTPVTVAANVTSDQLLMACSLNANLLNVTLRGLKVYAAGVFSTAAASTASLTFKAKLCTVSGCGSGTVISPITTTTGATAALSATNLSWSQTSYIVTQTAGASSAYEAHGFMTIDLSATAATPDSVYQDTNTATVGTIDSTGALFLQITVSASAGSTSNSFTERELVVEVLN